jgi:cytochrome c biogenesis protein CcmG/thiol:disulfide interchange protein DsbE
VNQRPDRNSAQTAQADSQLRRARPRTAARTRKAAVAAGGAVLLGVAGFLVVGGPSGHRSVQGAAVGGTPVPAVELIDFEGRRFSLDDYEGTPVVVNFWASWCPSCVAEMPDFERVHQQLRGRVAFVGVNQRDDRGAAEDLAAETGVSYRLAADPNGAVFDAFGGAGMPTTAFIDADGNVVDVVTGQLDGALLKSYIERSFGITV